MRNKAIKPNRHFFSPMAALAVVLACLTGLHGANAFTEPSVPYPWYSTYYSAGAGQLSVGQIPEFLNSSAAPQQKFGSLVIGRQGATCTFGGNTAGCARLCLNPNTQGAFGSSPITTDTTNCIYAWSNIAVSTSGLLTLFGTSVGNDRGYISIQAKPVSGDVNSGQLISLIATAPTGTAGGNIPTGISANGVATSTYSAQFAGTVAVVPADGTSSPQLCLNTKAGVEDCISSWSGVFQDTAIVKLQTMTAGNYRTPDVGNVSTSKVIVAGSLVAGTPVSTDQKPASCGDGICSSPYESSIGGTPQYCFQDCQ